MQILIQKMVLFAILIALGYLAMKWHFVSEDFDGKLSTFIINITMPAMILSTVTGGNPVESMSTAFFVLGLSTLVYLFLPYLGRLINHVLNIPHKDRSLYLYMTTFGNLGFMGLPVVEAVFGKTGLFYAALIHLIFNVFNWSFGISFMQDQKRVTFDIKMFKTPGIIASILALVIFLLNLEVSSMVHEVASLVGGVTSPLAMMTVGMNLAKIDLKEVFTHWPIYPYIILRQVAIPLLLRFLLGLVIHDAYLLGVFIIEMSMPVASASTMFALRYGRDSQVATRGVCMTTLLSLVTIPLVMYISGIPI